MGSQEPRRPRLLTFFTAFVFAVAFHGIVTAESKIIVATQNVNYKEGMEEAARRYMEMNPDITVEMIFITLNYETWVRTQFAAGESLAPDIYNGNVTNTYGRQGKWTRLNEYIEEVNPYTNKPWRETLEMNLVEKGKETGSYYHIPLDFIEIGVFYNKTIFEELGLTVPETWQEMLDLSERIEAEGLIAFAVPGVLREIWSGQVGWIARMLGDIYYRDLLPTVKSQEGDWDFDPDRDAEFVQDLPSYYNDMLVDISQERVHNAILDGTIDFRDPPTRRMFERIKEWSEYWQDGFLGSDSAVTHRLFLTQRAAMELHHSGNVSWMIQEMSDLPEDKRFEWGVFPIPSITNDPLAKSPMRGIGGIGSSLTVTKKSDPEHERNVIDFLMFLTSPEMTQIVFDLALENRRPITGPPAVLGVRLDDELQSRFEPFGGRGYEKFNFRGLEDEQESTYEWSVLLQDYLGDRITLDTMLENYHQSILRAQKRIQETNHLDLDPTTNDLARFNEQYPSLVLDTSPIYLRGPFIVAVLIAVFLALLGVSLSLIKNSLRRRNAFYAYAFLMPTFLLVLAFIYYPALSGLFAGFTEWEEGQKREFIGMQNFSYMMSDPILHSGIWNQILLLVTNLLKATIVPLIVAEMVIYLSNKRLQYWLRVGFVVPMVVPGMVALLIWGYIYDPQIGLLNRLLELIGLESQTRTWLGDPQFALSSIIFIGFPWIGAFGFLIYLAGLMSIPTSTMDYSKIECRSTFQRIFYIDFPLVMGQTRLLVILTMIGSIQDFQTILILTSGGPGTSTMIPALKMFFDAFRFNHFGYAAAIGFILFAIILTVTLMSHKFMKTVES